MWLCPFEVTLRGIETFCRMPLVTLEPDSGNATVVSGHRNKKSPALAGLLAIGEMAGAKLSSR